MRICHVVASLAIGGMERVVSELLSGQEAIGEQGYLFCTDTEGELYAGARAVAKKATRRTPGPLVLDFSVVRELVAFLKEHKIEVVHAHNTLAYLYATIACVLARRPLIVTFHGMMVGLPESMVRVRDILSWFTHSLVVVSEEIKESFAKKNRIRPDKVKIILNGVNTDLIRPVENKPSEGVLFGTMGRLASVKNYPLLVDAFQDLLLGGGEGVDMSKVKLVVCGDGPEMGTLRQKVEAQGLQGKVELVGAQSDVVSWYHKFDVFCLSSFSEGLPMVILEAAACGLPIVATNVGGIHGVVETGVSGILVPSEDRAAYTQALRTLLLDPQKRQQMGAKARQRVVEAYSKRVMVEQYQALYHEAVGNKK